MFPKNTSIDSVATPEEFSRNHGISNFFINALLNAEILGGVGLWVVFVTQNKGENLNIGTFPRKY
jgi:hypothetical protein